VPRIDRRRFTFALTASAAAAAWRPRRAGAAMEPYDKYDLLIKGGHVLDPSRGLDGARDIGIRNGVIESVEAEPPRTVRPMCPHVRILAPHPR
jgi:dihydroorotase